MALSALRWGLVTRSTSEKRNRYTSSWGRVQEKEAGSTGSGGRVGQGPGLRQKCAHVDTHVHRDKCTTGMLELEGVSAWPLLSLYRQGKCLTWSYKQSFSQNHVLFPVHTEVT